MSIVQYIPRRNIFTAIKYGLLYNWYAAVKPQTVEYGYLYNWYAATDARNIANTGWRLSTHADWQYIATYLAGWSGGQFVANLGGKLKETGTTHWNSPNTDATNIAGFNARGGGRRNQDGTFTTIKETSNYHTELVIEPYGPIVWAAGNTNGNMTWGFSASNYILGASVRLVKETTTLTNGQTGTYVGNDGRIYNTICIGTKEWLSEDLWETRYRNGDEIPEVTDNTAWSNLTTGARCAYNNTITNVGLGNAITSSDDWVVPSKTDIETLFLYYDPAPIDGIYYTSAIELKEAGLTYWNSPNAASNISGMGLRGCGDRNGGDGSFAGLKDYGNWYCSTKTGANVDGFYTDNSSGYIWPIEILDGRMTDGYGLRLIYTGAGTPTFYMGNDGKKYRVVTIGTQTWLADNLAETKYRDGSYISGYDGGVYTPIADATWAALTTGALCAYSDDTNNI